MAEAADDLHITNGGASPQAIETRIAGHSSACTANPGESYYSPDGSGWTDLTSFDSTANFSIKALEERTGMGYTALRSRLDRLIANYRRLLEGEDEKRKILDELAEGKITASEATDRISRIPSAGHGTKD